MKIKNLFIVGFAIMLALPMSAQTRKGTRTRTTTTTTKKPTQQATIAKPQWVDLGLPSGTKWADRNVDAKSTTSIGGYYAYGETSTKKLYSEDNYTFNADLDNIAGTEYDVATKKYGKGWSIPTMEQWQELFDNCTRMLVTVNNQSVLKCTGPNGKFIYLPMPTTKAMIKAAKQNVDISAELSEEVLESFPAYVDCVNTLQMIKAYGGTGKMCFAIYRVAEKGFVVIGCSYIKVYGEAKNQSFINKINDDRLGYLGFNMHSVFNDTTTNNTEDTGN